MAITSGITEKRLADKRFKKTEATILRVFLKENSDININSMAKKVGVARSTIYHHHRTIHKIIPDYEKYILSKYRWSIRKTLKATNSRTHIIYFKTLCFIMTNKKIFQMLIRFEGDKIFRKMISEITPKIKDSMRLPKNSKTLYSVYTGEVIKIIENWCENGFEESDLDDTLEKIIFLTKTARSRLNKLLD